MSDFIGVGKFLNTELREYEPEILDTIYPEYWGFEGKHIPTKGDLMLGLRKVVYARMDTVGRAVNYGGRATSIPLANFGITLEETPTLVGILAAEWGYFDLEAEKVAKKFPQLLQGRDLVKNYRLALEKGLREWMNIRAIFGDPSVGFRGLLNNAKVTQINETLNLYTATPSDLYNWWITRQTAFKKANYLTSKGIQALVSPDMMLALTKRFGDASGDGNGMKMLQSLFGKITEVNELSAAVLEQYGVLAPGTNKDMILFYENSPDVLDRRFTPIEITDAKLLDDQITYRTVGFCATTEVRVKQPLRVQYILYPKF
jgi:hypothetical protein